MAKKSKLEKLGICCICGKEGKLSFEHVPPKSAFNAETTIHYQWEDFLRQHASKATHGIRPSKSQGGVGDYTPCESCNNNTGAWYAGEYVKWARTCNRLMGDWSSGGVKQGTVCLPNVYPLRFLKQVVTCFFSLLGSNSDGNFAKTAPELVQYVLEKENQILPNGYRFYMNLYNYSINGKTHLRRWPLSAQMFAENNTYYGVVFSNIDHPPFQLIMTMEDEVFPNATDITHFSNYAYSDKVNLEINLRIASSDSPWPGAG